MTVQATRQQNEECTVLGKLNVTHVIKHHLHTYFNPENHKCELDRTLPNDLTYTHIAQSVAACALQRLVSSTMINHYQTSSKRLNFSRQHNA
jgi:hypothetical protein